MRSVRAKVTVVRSKIVTRAKCPEGTKPFLVVDESRPAIELDDTAEAAIRAARASIRAGRTVELDKLMAALGRF